MHDVASEFARAVVRSKDAQKQLARTSLSINAIVNTQSETIVALVRQSGEGTPLHGLYRYVQPQRVWAFSRFGHR